MKYKVGDKVRVKKDLEVDKSYEEATFVEEIKKFRGKVVTIGKAFAGLSGKDRYNLKEDGEEWYWSDDMLEPITTNWDKLKEVSTGKFVGIGFCNVINIMRKETNCFGRSCKECKEWLEQPYEEFNEEVREILDEAEKKYLSAVIKPFRDKVLHIEKQLGGIGEYITISLGYDGVCLPYYKRGTMYKGMGLGRPYTLEELGL